MGWLPINGGGTSRRSSRIYNLTCLRLSSVEGIFVSAKLNFEEGQRIGDTLGLSLDDVLESIRPRKRENLSDPLEKNREIHHALTLGIQESDACLS